MEATGLIRRTQAAGDFAAILHKGDAERGSLLLVVRSRGDFVSCLERTLDLSGTYRWQVVGAGQVEEEPKLAEFLRRRVEFDPDIWLIELDVAQPEQFIAETTSAG